MLKFDTIIERLLKTHVGGESYFSALDAELLTADNFDITEELVKGFEDTNWVVTGNYGFWLLANREELGLKGELRHFSGNLREDKHPALLAIKGNPCGENYTFLDDSFYSGKTYNKIVDIMAFKYDKRVNQIRVAYDGSKRKPDNITSLYRYYERHGNPADTRFAELRVSC